MKPITILAAAALAALAPAAHGEAAADARFAATTLDVRGHGEARAAPDQATVELGVQARAAGAGAAQDRASAAMAAVIAAVRARGVEARDIQTTEVGLSPQFVYAEGKPAKLTGYEAENRISVTLEDLSRLGAMMDAAVGAGATSVGDVRLGLKSPAAAEAYASLEAIKALEDKAQAYATAAGYRIGRLVSLSESTSSPAPPPRPMMADAAMAARAAPVEAGVLTISVDVSGEFELTR